MTGAVRTRPIGFIDVDDHQRRPSDEGVARTSEISHRAEGVTS
jgi:hypothetical protein